MNSSAHIPRSPRTLASSPPRKHLSMHEGVAVWCDCCSCEAEPYWQAVADELGITLGDDYEPSSDDASTR